MRSLALRAGLNAAELLARAMPGRAAYALADVLGRAWHRRAPGRRALVAEGLRRVCAATGRPTDGPVFRRMVERSFVEYARYYVEVLRAPHYDPARVHEHVSHEDWDRFGPLLRAGAVVALPHLGNFEPFGHFVEAERVTGVAPVEETEPPELYDFLRSRRAAGHGMRVVPLSRARRPMIEALRNGEIAALVADRDLDGDGIPVAMFGHPATLPAGPATLAVLTERPLVVARSLRTGPDRFRARAWLLDTAPRDGEDRRARIARITRDMGAHFETAIAEAPEQWWAIFQPYWTDQRT
jgi:KDO2-lipid IV(A) lauroyltransferase